MSVSKIDGIGTRKDGSSGETANKGSATKFVRLFLKASQTVTKGDVVAFDFAASEPDSGYGNNIIAATTTALSDACVGIAAETLTVDSGVADQPVLIQVGGLCDFATIDSGATDGVAGVSNASADIVDAAAHVDVPFCIIVKRTAKTVYLLNPYNL